MDKGKGFAMNKLIAVAMVLLAPASLAVYDAPRSYLLACAVLCLAWYEAFGLMPNVGRNATIPDVYRAYRTMPARASVLSTRLVGLLGIVLMLAAIFAPL